MLFLVLVLVLLLLLFGSVDLYDGSVWYCRTEVFAVYVIIVRYDKLLLLTSMLYICGV